MMSAKESVDRIIQSLGGMQNIISVTNCMTRLRVVTKDESAVNEAELNKSADVLGLVHDRACAYEIVVGPGKSRRYADLCHEMGLPSGSDSGYDWQENKKKIQAGQKENKLKASLKVIGDIFVPLIPGVIAAGLCAGIASLISQLVPNYADIPVWNIVYSLLSLINTAFMTYITAWAGYRAAERFGATPILGGMLGLITCLDGINTIAASLGLYNDAQPLQSILRSGKGGVLAVIVGVFILSYVEKKIRKIMPNSLDIVFTPLLSLIAVAIPYILIIMPLFGYISSGIVWVFGKACMSESPAVRMITGYLASAVFLPLVASGMHHGMVALYSVQLQEIGYVTLYPALAMAGAGQIGAALAIMRKAKKKDNRRLVSVIKGALPAGFLGIGEPLIYGVTLPLGKPFITSGIGAGFGGAFVMLMQVASTTWGPSGLLGVFVMTEGPKGALSSIICYLIGLLISYLMSYVITNIFVSADEITPTQTPERKEQTVPAKTDDIQTPQISAHKKIVHGTPISFDTPEDGCFEFTYTVKDKIGLHARPAGELARIIKSFDCRFTVEANGRTAVNGSVMQLMSLGASQGSLLKCKAEGRDAKSAIDAVEKFLNEKL